LPQVVGKHSVGTAGAKSGVHWLGKRTGAVMGEFEVGERGGRGRQKHIPWRRLLAAQTNFLGLRTEANTKRIINPKGQHNEGRDENYNTTERAL